MMKAKYALAILVMGFCFDFAGGYFKITHQGGADTILLFAMVLKIVGALLFLYKLWVYPKFQDFLNR